MKRVLIYFALMLLFSLGLAAAAGASRPIAATIRGCVLNGTMYSIKKGGSPATGKAWVRVYPIRVLHFDLAPYEGQKVRLNGSLYPGDRFAPDPKSLKVLGPCDRKSQAAIFKKMESKTSP